MENKNILLGIILLTIFTTGGIIWYTFPEAGVRYRIDKDQTTLYIKSPMWKVYARELNSLWDGSSKLNRDLSNTYVSTTYNNITNISITTRITTYQRGPVIKDTYLFDGKLKKIKDHPKYHYIEIFNASGYIYQWEIRDIREYNGNTIKNIQGPLDFGRVIIEWDEGSYWNTLYKSKLFKVRWRIKSDYIKLENKLYDPPGPEITINYPIDERVFPAGQDSMTLNATVTYSSNMNVTFYNASDNSIICSVLDVSNGTAVNCTWPGLLNETGYTWYINTSSGSETTISDNQTFYVSDILNGTIMLDVDTMTVNVSTNQIDCSNERELMIDGSDYDLRSILAVTVSGIPSNKEIHKVELLFRFDDFVDHYRSHGYMYVGRDNGNAECDDCMSYLDAFANDQCDLFNNDIILWEESISVNEANLVWFNSSAEGFGAGSFDDKGNSKYIRIYTSEVYRNASKDYVYFHIYLIDADDYPSEGDLYGEDGTYPPTFQVWYRKTNISLISPSNGAVNQSWYDNITLSVKVIDIEDSSFNVSFYNYETDEQIGSTQLISNNTAVTQTWDVYTNTTYFWYADVTYGTNMTRSDVFNFSTIEENNPPGITLNYPADNNITSDTTPDFNFTVTDPIELYHDCDVYVNNTPFGLNTTVLNNTATIITANHSIISGTHEWYVNCTDDEGNQNKSVNRTIIINRNPVVTLNHPLNNALFSPDTTSVTLNITVTDVDNDSMNVTFYMSNGTQLYNQSNVANGTTLNYTWTGLTNKTVYHWYVNITDAYTIMKSTTWTFSIVIPSNTILYINGSSEDNTIELGEIVFINATSDNPGMITCLYINHPDFMNGYCGSNNSYVEINWTSSAGTNEFLGGNTTSSLSFNTITSQSHELSLVSIRNKTEYLNTSVSINGSESYGYNKVFPTQNEYACGNDTYWFTDEEYASNRSHTCEDSKDGNFYTYWVPNNNGINYIYLNFSIPIGFNANDINLSADYTDDINSSEFYCWNGSSWEKLINDSVINDTANSLNISLISSCDTTNGTLQLYLPISKYFSLRRSWIILNMSDYPYNIQIDTDANGTQDWVSSGKLINKTTYLEDFNGFQSKTMHFLEPGIQYVNITLPKNINVSYAELTIEGNNGFIAYVEGRDFISDKSFYGPTGAYDPDSGLFYIFGGIYYSPLTDNNITLKWEIGTLNLTEDESNISIGAFSCIEYWNSTTPYGSTGFFIFGGVTSAESKKKAYFYNISSNSFINLSDLTNEVYGLGCVISPSREGIYIFGNETYGNTSSNYFYNISLDTYTAISGFTAGDNNNGIDAIIDPTDSNYILLSGLGDYIYRYNISGDSFEQYISGVNNGCGMKYSRIEVINDEIWCLSGGFLSPIYNETNKTILKYDPRLNKTGGITHYIREIPENQTNNNGPGYCDIVDEHIACVTGYMSLYLNPEEFHFNYQEIWFTPSDVSIQIATNTSWNHSGDFTGSETITTLANDINIALSDCTPNSDGYCNIPIYVINGKVGEITISDLEIRTNISSINLNITNTTCELNTCNQSVNITAEESGTITLYDLNLTWEGTNNLTVNATSTGEEYNTSSNIHYLVVYFSNWDYSFPGNINYLEFIPSTPTSKNVTPYGQTTGKPILNITFGTLDKNASWFALINESYSCVNLSFGINETSKTLMTNNTWIKFIDNKGSDYSQSIYMWADYDCNYSSWRLWEPEFFFRACCEGCICTEEVS